MGEGRRSAEKRRNENEDPWDPNTLLYGEESREEREKNNQSTESIPLKQGRQLSGGMKGRKG